PVGLDEANPGDVGVGHHAASHMPETLSFRATAFADCRARSPAHSSSAASRVHGCPRNEARRSNVARSNDRRTRSSVRSQLSGRGGGQRLPANESLLADLLGSRRPRRSHTVGQYGGTCNAGASEGARVSGGGRPASKNVSESGGRGR